MSNDQTADRATTTPGKYPQWYRYYWSQERQSACCELPRASCTPRQTSDGKYKPPPLLIPQAGRSSSQAGERQGDLLGLLSNLPVSEATHLHSGATCRFIQYQSHVPGQYRIVLSPGISVVRCQQKQNDSRNEKTAEISTSVSIIETKSQRYKRASYTTILSVLSSISYCLMLA